MRLNRSASGLLDTRAEAERQTRLGALRLFVLAEHRELRTQVRWLPNLEKIRLYAAPLAKSGRWKTSSSTWSAPGRSTCWTTSRRDAASFEAQKLAGRKHILPAVQEVTKLVAAIFEAYHELRLALEQPRPATWNYAIDDLRDQLAALSPEGFLTTTPWSWLQHVPRRSQGHVAAADKNQIRAASPATARPTTRSPPAGPPTGSGCPIISGGGRTTPELAHFRWMIEELRVSLFAQELGTSIPVSPQRLDKQWAKNGALEVKSNSNHCNLSGSPSGADLCFRLDEQDLGPLDPAFAQVDAEPAVAVFGLEADGGSRAEFGQVVLGPGLAHVGRDRRCPF